MDVFSLEEEEGSELFLTQEVRSKEKEDKSDSFCGVDPMNFEEPCRSLVGNGTNEFELPYYSDISDEDFEMENKSTTSDDG